MSFLTDPSWSHKRLVWRSATGRRRVLWACWDDQAGLWRCRITGAGIRGHEWTATTQSAALGHARLRSWCADGRWRLTTPPAALYTPWDGRPDVPRLVPRTGHQLSLLIDTPPAQTGGSERAAQPRRCPAGASEKSLSNTGLLSQFETDHQSSDELSLCFSSSDPQGRGGRLLSHFSESVA